MMLAVCQREAALSTQSHISGTTTFAVAEAHGLFTSLVLPALHGFLVLLSISRKMEFISEPRRHLYAIKVMNPVSRC